MIEAVLAGFLTLGRKPQHERVGFHLYGAAVAAARNPFLYVDLGAPDTLDGRFDVIGLHVFLLIQRLKRDLEPGPALAQAVFDAMFLDMDINLREMGVGDMSVGKRNRAMWEAFHGRAAAYAAAWEDDEALEKAFARNVWRGADPPAGSAAALRRVARAQDRALDEQPLAALQQGIVTFLPAEEAAR
ncbi:ubiquinol-cytochrome C chaperone family protein [Rhodopila sp.]|uniref:ubiquinol-cytochrome C chaperone family protein n=1 Tax=Rhodopila sp. TaxID=2480087 RepID=UPI003D0ADF20